MMSSNIEPNEPLSDIDVAFKRFIERALLDDELELEIGIESTITPPMFRRLVKSLSFDATVTDTLQLDVIFDGRRYEFHGQELVESFVRAPNDGIRPSKVLVKRREMAPLQDLEEEYTIRLKREMDVTAQSPSLVSSTPLPYRLKRRFSRVFDVCRIDCTLVKSRSDGEQQETLGYEVEVEMSAPADTDPLDILTKLKGMVSTCLKVMKGTTRPPGPALYSALMSKYKSSVDTTTTTGRLIAPQPVTLELDHIQPTELLSIWGGDYTVTDKADGTRCHLIIYDSVVYTLDAAMTARIVATGASKDLEGTWLDGELITNGKMHQSMNHLACFDIYRIGSKDVTSLPLFGELNSRIHHLKTVTDAVSQLKRVDDFTISTKRFELVTKSGRSIREILDAAKSNPSYETDGLIFTPAVYPVGARHATDSPSIEGTWAQVYKWKPPELNTIDFLVRNIQKNGIDVYGSFTDSDGVVHRTSKHILYLSYRPKEWESVDVSKFIQFGPRSLPSGMATPKPFEYNNRDLSGMEVSLDSSNRSKCLNGDFIYHNTVVECTWDASSERWIPMRLRPEKTARLDNGIGGAANNWGTALSVWRSIVHPITEDVITGLTLPPLPPHNDNVKYYADRTFSRDRSSLKNMALFHNVCIKDTLYKDSASNGSCDECSLFEMACGKGGDIPRWIAHGFKTVVGTDLSMDNIVNARDGIYERLSKNRDNVDLKRYVFVSMDSTTRMKAPLDEIKSLAATSPHGDVIEALWDTSQTSLPNSSFHAIKGLVHKGFDVVSCQFAIHYMFKNDITLDRFIDNVSYLCHVGGIFIGTTFDGNRVATELEESGGKVEGKTASHVSWSIEKKYESKFNGSPGHAISVFVETIGQASTEYLVDLRVLENRLKSAGFEKVYIKGFAEFFPKFIEMNSDGGAMSDAEKALSSKNVMFMFRKIR